MTARTKRQLAKACFILSILFALAAIFGMLTQSPLLLRARDFTPLGLLLVVAGVVLNKSARSGEG